jgi:predicted nucleic acid-binding protein
VVLDASAALTLVLDPGESGDAVRRAIGANLICAPTLLPYEVTNVLRRRWSARLLSDAEAALAFDSFGLLAIELWQWAALAERVWQLKGSITAYAAAYVALAELLDCPLLTGDAKLAAAVPPTCTVIRV